MRWMRWGVLIGLAGCVGLPMTQQSTTTQTETVSRSDFPGDPDLPWEEIGRSVEGRAIYALTLGSGDDVTLIFSCFHGNERSTPHLANRFAEYLHAHPEHLGANRLVIVVPMVNPDGYARRTRRNARDVDLNRNFPTRNWGEPPADGRKVYFGRSKASEPETKAILKLLGRYPADKIISIHQPLHCNNSDGPRGLPLAEVMAQYNGYPVKPHIGFPTPGSFGTFAGKELGVPMVTLELPRGGPGTVVFDRMWEANRDALLAAVSFRP